MSRLPSNDAVSNDASVKVGVRLGFSLALVLTLSQSPARGAGAVPDAIPASSDEAVLKALRNTPLHDAPSAQAKVLATVPAGSLLFWIDQGQRDGYYRVINAGPGPQGWIPSKDLELVRSRREHAPRPDQPCAESLARCPLRGCADEGSPTAQINRLKRTRPAESVRATLHFEDFATLQRLADERVGSGPRDIPVQRRALLKDLPVAGTSVSEGDRVRLIAYLAKDEGGLHVNDIGESVNCRLKASSANDFHIPVVADAGESQFESIVAEMIPQDRPRRWTLSNLEDVLEEGRQVLIEGGLFYDNLHYVNADPANPLAHHPDRSSLWEIHPVTRFVVCEKRECDPDRPGDWKRL